MRPCDIDFITRIIKPPLPMEAYCQNLPLPIEAFPERLIHLIVKDLAKPELAGLLDLIGKH